MVELGFGIITDSNTNDDQRTRSLTAVGFHGSAQGFATLPVGLFFFRFFFILISFWMTNERITDWERLGEGEVVLVINEGFAL